MAIYNANELTTAFYERGFHYSRDLIFNYFLSLISKPFAILTGISGSGKSKIAEVFAEIIADENNKNYELVPVKPNWRDNKGLFGYHNVIDDSYYITPLIRLFIRALNDPNHPYFLILDEMNIAKTEHYFADYLSIIESRRGKRIPADDSEVATFTYEGDTSLSEAIILAAFDLGDTTKYREIKEYRENRFSIKWKEQRFGGAPDNWTPQFRSELNQGDGRLAHRVFEGGNGNYRFKDKSLLSPEDQATLQRLEKLYRSLVKPEKIEILQDNMVLHNSPVCIGADGVKCNCMSCPYVNNNSEKYKCSNLYDSETQTYLVPPEMPIPLNVFTIGTVNVDETTYMFSPKVLDRSNVIEFNEVDFTSLYALTEQAAEILKQNTRIISDSEFYFDEDMDMPSMEVTLATKACVDTFIAKDDKTFENLLKIFSVLKKYNLHFGYRVMNEISCYMCNALKYTSYEHASTIALDNQILQKVLPKMHGSYEKLWAPLVEILSVLSKSDLGLNTNVDAAQLVEQLSRAVGTECSDFNIDTDTLKSTFKYPKSAMKILEMLDTLSTSGFAAFIK